MKLPQSPWEGIGATGNQQSSGAALVSAVRCPELCSGLKNPQNSPIAARSPSLQIGDWEKELENRVQQQQEKGWHRESSSRSLSLPLCAASRASPAPSVPLPGDKGQSGEAWSSVGHQQPWLDPGWILGASIGISRVLLQPGRSPGSFLPCPLRARNYPARGLAHNRSHAGRKVAIKLTPPGTSWPGEGQK